MVQAGVTATPNPGPNASAEESIEWSEQRLTAGSRPPWERARPAFREVRSPCGNYLGLNRSSSGASLVRTSTEHVHDRLLHRAIDELERDSVSASRILLPKSRIDE
jgi:hypothetical protein